MSANVGRRVLAAYPGEEVLFSVGVHGPRGHVVSVIIDGVPGGVASTSISPNRMSAPYVSTVTMKVHQWAKPGLYPFNVLVRDEVEGRLLGSEPLALLVLPHGVPRAFAREYKRVVNLYRTKGAMWAVWYMLSHVFTNGASFTQLKEAYEAVAGRKVSKGTVGNILSRMIRKKLVQRDPSGLYRVLVLDEKIVDSRIDEKRVRVQVSEDRNRVENGLNKGYNALEARELPYATRLAWQRALRIKQVHGALPAMYFLVHTVLGVRETGLLLYWRDKWFITCENKTGFCHHYISECIEWMFRKLGVKPGVMYREDEYSKNARRIAYRYIHRYYGSFANARRVHYELKQYNLIEYDEDVYVVEIIHYIDGDLGVRIWDENREKLLTEENIKDESIKHVEVKSAFPYEHEDPKNEETYFHRLAGLY